MGDLERCDNEQQVQSAFAEAYRLRAQSRSEPRGAPDVRDIDADSLETEAIIRPRVDEHHET